MKFIKVISLNHLVAPRGAVCVKHVRTIKEGVSFGFASQDNRKATRKRSWDVGGRWKRQEPQVTKRRTGTLVEETGTAGNQEANWDVGGRDRNRR